MVFEKVVYEIKDGIAYITMNYMKNLNAIDTQMAGELIDVLDQAEQDKMVKIIVLQGTDRAFSAGGDIGYFYNQLEENGEINMDDLISQIGTLADKIKRLSKIVITSVSGPAAGAGASLALSGDFVICEERAKIIFAFVNLGLAPDTGATYLLAKSIGSAKTMDFIVTGRPMLAEEAQDLGLVYKVVPKEDLKDTVHRFASKLANGPLVAYQNIKRQVYDAIYSDYTTWLKGSEAYTQNLCSKTEDFKEGCRAFIEKRKPNYSGC